MDNTFYFNGCVEIKELLGKKASDIEELLEYIEEAPLDSIYYHTHGYFLRHPYIAGEYPNDFADWVAIQIRDKILGEKLATVTPKGNETLQDVRNHLIEIIDNYINEINHIPSLTYGRPFYFMQSHIIEIPTGLKASNLKEFIETLKIVNISAIYNHIFEARLRDNLGRSDFSIWLDLSLKEKELAEEIETIDFYMYSLEGLRKKLIKICEKRIKNG